MRQNECSRETRKRERLEKEARQTQADLEAKQAELKVLGLQTQKGKEEQQRLEQQLREQKVSRIVSVSEPARRRSVPGPEREVTRGGAGSRNGGPAFDLK